jgi:hypothetical protein
MAVCALNFTMFVNVCVGTVEERQWTALKTGQELIKADNRKEKFIFV